MPSIVLKDVPVEIHARLKEDAASHRRSMNQHALALLEQALSLNSPRTLPPPIRAGRRWTAKEIRAAIRAGRE